MANTNASDETIELRSETNNVEVGQGSDKSSIQSTCPKAQMVMQFYMSDIETQNLLLFYGKTCFVVYINGIKFVKKNKR